MQLLRSFADHWWGEPSVGRRAILFALFEDLEADSTHIHEFDFFSLEANKYIRILVSTWS